MTGFTGIQDEDKLTSQSVHVSPFLQEELQRDYYLWQVFHLEHDIEKARKQAAKHMEAAANIQRDQSIAEKEV